MYCSPAWDSKAGGGGWGGGGGYQSGRGDAFSVKSAHQFVSNTLPSSYTVPASYSGPCSGSCHLRSTRDLLPSGDRIAHPGRCNDTAGITKGWTLYYKPSIAAKIPMSVLPWLRAHIPQTSTYSWRLRSSNSLCHPRPTSASVVQLLCVDVAAPPPRRRIRICRPRAQARARSHRRWGAVAARPAALPPHAAQRVSSCTWTPAPVGHGKATTETGSLSPCASPINDGGARLSTHLQTMNWGWHHACCQRTMLRCNINPMRQCTIAPP